MFDCFQHTGIKNVSLNLFLYIFDVVVNFTIILCYSIQPELIFLFVSYDFAKFTYSNSFFVDSFGLLYKIMSSANKDSFISCIQAFYFFFLPYSTGRTSGTMLNKKGRVGSLALFLFVHLKH